MTDVKPIPHGTSRGYDTYKCRCEGCKTAKQERTAKYYAESREKRLAYNAANAVAIRLRVVQWRGKNADRRRATDAAYQAAHFERYLVDQVVLRARRIGIELLDIRLVSKRDWLALCSRHNNRCAYCGCSEPLTKDHVIPIARGGRHSIGNLLPACRRCNASKRNSLLVEWRARKRRSSQ